MPNHLGAIVTLYIVMKHKGRNVYSVSAFITISGREMDFLINEQWVYSSSLDSGPGAGAVSAESSSLGPGAGSSSSGAGSRSESSP